MLFIIESIVSITNFLWEGPLLVLIILVGLYYATKIYHNFFYCIKKTFKTKANRTSNLGEIPLLNCLLTAMSGTIGSGNIVGVAVAISVGGPGSLFWIWIVSIICMIVKMIEVAMAVKYRTIDISGKYWGGPMYYINKGIKGKIGVILGKTYAIFLIILVITDACFVQVNTFATTLQNVFGFPAIISGIIWACFGIIVLKMGSSKRITNFCKLFAPFMCAIYIIGTVIIIIYNHEYFPNVIKEIFYYAFNPTPIIGGFAGATIMMTISKGFSRGIFSNEAGQGTSTTIYAKSIVEHPIEAGLYSIIEVITDCFICTVTGFSVLITSSWKYGLDGIALNLKAFHSLFGIWGEFFVCIIVCFFTFSSYISFFIEYCTSLKYLFSTKIAERMSWFYFVSPFLSVTLSVNIIWTLADMAVGFIILPNMVALILLNKEFSRLWKSYVDNMKMLSKNTMLN